MLVSATTPDLSELRARPLFHASRRSSRPDEKQQPDVQQVLTFETAYAVKGMLRIDETMVLIVEHRQSKRSFSVAPGQILDGHKLQVVDASGAVFENDQRQRVILPRPGP
jgi:hypothetical protein